MKRLIAGFAFVAATSVGYADFMGGGGMSNPAWIYLPAEGVISNNNEVGVSTDWVLNVKALDSTKRTLSIGRGTGGDAYVLKEGSIAGGATLDLSEPIADVEGKQWTIAKFNSSCFRRTDAPTSPVRTFVAPKELVTIEGKIFDYDIPEGASVEATFDCPLLTAIPNGTCGKSWVTLHLKAPRCTYIDSYALTSFAKIDVSEWDLTGVENIGKLALPWPDYPYGSLKLPRLKKIGERVFGLANYTRMEWGNRFNTLTSVGEAALNASCEEIVLGCARGCVFAKNAINAGNLKRVWMTGAVPSFTTEEVSFGVNQGEKTMVFYVPDTEAWAAIRTAATPLTEEETAAFRAEHPDWDMPFGVVEASVFRTKNAQYIGTADLVSLGVMSKIKIESRSQGQYGDAWEIRANGEVVEDGEVPLNAEVTVTAKPAKSSTIVIWEGSLPDGTTPAGNSFAFANTESVSLYAVFAHAWEYDAGTSTISDGYWTLPVVANANARELTVSKVSGSMTSSQMGELNLSGPVYAKGAIGDEDERWAIVNLEWQAFGSSPARITSFYAPTTLKTVGGQLFNGASTLDNYVFNCPELTGNFGDWGFMLGGSEASRIVLNAPKLTSIGQNSETRSFTPATFTGTMLTEWDLTGLKSVRPGGLATSATTGGPQGDLVLPNVETIEQSAFDGWTRIASVAFGTNGTLKTLGPTLFWNPNAKNGLAAGPKKIDFGTSSDFTVDARAFYAELPGKVDAYPNGQPLPIEEVWFAGEAPSVETLDNILALQEVAADGTKPVKIFAPMMEKTWRAVCKPFTTEEASMAYAMKADGLRVIGVYQTKDSRRVAWLVQNPGFEYHTGFTIRIR